MNTLKSNIAIEDCEITNITHIVPTQNHDALSVTMAFVAKTRKDTIEIDKSCQFDVMYDYDGCSASITTITYVDELGKIRVLNSNCRNTECIQYDADNKCIIVKGVIKSCIANVLFDIRIKLTHLIRIECYDTIDFSNYELKAQRAQYLAEMTC